MVRDGYVHMNAVPEEAIDPLEQELQAVMSCPTRVLGTKLRSCAVA